VWVCLLLAGGLLPGAAGAEAPGGLPLQVRRLVRQLDDNQLATREAAERELIELGPEALDLLPSPGRDTSAEVRVRLERVRKTLQEEAAKAAAEPSRVTLQGEMPLSAALAAVQQQTGNRIVDFRQRFGQQPHDPQLKFDFDKQPFWTAFDVILDRAGMTLYNFSGEAKALAVVARDQAELDRASRAVYEGLFRFEVLRVLAIRELRNPAHHSLRLVLEITWEPRVPPILLQIPLGDLRATDDAGRAMEIGSKRANLEVPVESAIPAAEVQVPLSLPDRSVNKIASLRGQLSALVPGQVEAFEFSNLGAAESVEQSRAGVTVVLEQVRKNVDVYELRLRVRFDQARNALESHRNWIYGNEAYFIGPDRQRFEHVGQQAFRQTENEVGVAYLSDRENGLADCKFVYKTPAVLIQMPVAFELKDIPLP